MSQIPNTAVADPQAGRRVALAGGIGTLIEYYDFALYGYLAL